MKNSALLFIILFFLNFSKTFSQDAIVLSPVDIRNTITLEDLWNMNVSMIKPTNFLSFYLTLEVKDASGTPLVKAETAPFRLQQGVLSISQINLDILQPLKVYYYSQNFYIKTLQNGGYFPSGTFVVKYILYGTANDPVAGTVTELMASADFIKTIDLLYPPMLLEPFNGDDLDDIQSVVFSWTPAMDNNSLSVNYTIRIAEVWDGITPAEALASSSLFYMATELPETFHTYPPEAAGFAVGRLYAWQVTAYFDNNSSINSEYFTFTYHPPKPEPNYEATNVRIKSKQYAIPQQEIDGSYFTIFDTLRVCYEEPYSVQPTEYLHFAVYDKNNNAVLLPQQSEPGNTASITGPFITSGTNYINLPINLANLPKDEYYTLIITNAKKEQWFLRFFIAGDDIPYTQINN